jgi:hypothetical protein
MSTSPTNQLRQTLWLVAGFAICFFAGGWVCWRDSYQEYLNAGFHNWETFPLLAGVAFVLSWIVGAGLLPSALSVGIAFPAIVLARVVMDCVQDPTNHNLWPFELVVALVLGMVVAFPSAAIGWLLRRVTHRTRPSDPEPERNE